MLALIHAPWKLEELGAVGDICLRFYDADGVAVASPLDERVIGIDLERLKRPAQARGDPRRAARALRQRADHRPLHRRTARRRLGAGPRPPPSGATGMTALAQRKIPTTAILCAIGALVLIALVLDTTTRSDKAPRVTGGRVAFDPAAYGTKT